MCKAVVRAIGLAPKMPALPPMQPAPAVPPVAVAPPPAPAPAPVTPDGAPQTVAQRMDTVDAGAQADERMRAVRARGRASTILTGGQGDTSAPLLARPMATGAATRTLLG